MGSLWDKPAFSFHAYSYEGAAVVIVAALLALVGLFVAFGTVFDWAGSMAAEAKRKDKRIEFGSMVIAVLAFVFSVISLAISLNGQSDADARITKLEQAAKAATAPAARPDQREPRP